MSDFKLFSRCEVCKRRRFYIAKRRIAVEIGKIATSRRYMCGRCIWAITSKLATNHGSATTGN